jgi:hypothetical protein
VTRFAFAPVFALALALASRVDAAPDPDADVKAFGARARADLERRYPALAGDAAGGEIPSLGSCRRPDAAERQALRALVAPGVADDELEHIAYGCVERGDVVVDVAFDTTGANNRRTGVWRIVRANAATAAAATLATYSGTSIQDFMEWADEVTVATLALVDVDGDGVRDVVIARRRHEGGSSSSETELSLWRSRDGRVVPIGTFGGARADVRVARGSGRALVLAFERARDDNAGAAVWYACVDPRGGVRFACADGARARRIARRLEIAAALADGAYAPLDRDRAAELFAELDVPAAARRALLAALPPATPEVLVAREIERVLAPVDPETPVAPPDPRPAALARLLGDAPCAPASAAESRRLAAWIAANDARELVAHGDCDPAAPCRWTNASAPAPIATCAADGRGYIAATWIYEDDDARLVRAAAFAFSPTTFALLATATQRDDGPDCPACAPRAGPILEVDFHRRGAKSIATIADKSPNGTMTTFVDGAPAAAPPPGATWCALDDPYVQARDCVEAPDKVAGEYFYFDGARWQSFLSAEAGFGRDAALPPSASRAARFVFDVLRRAEARRNLATFDAAAWTRDPAARARTRRDLALARMQ